MKFKIHLITSMPAGAAEMRKQKVSEVHNTSSADNDEEGFIGRRLTLSDVMSYSKVKFRSTYRKGLRGVKTTIEISQRFFKPITRSDQRGRLGNWKTTKMRISLAVLSELFLNYGKTLDISIHQFVHMEFSDGILSILLNF